MTFKALVVDKNEEGKTSAAVKEIDENQLPDGNVTVAVEYSTLNYKDGLCVGPGGGLVKDYPHVPGIDFAGTVDESSDEWYKPGDKVVLTGWRVGEVWWGGYAQKASVKGEWLVPLPDGLTTRDAMAVGTAGFTAMLAVMALEDHGLKPDERSGSGHGCCGRCWLSRNVAILANLGYEVHAVTGRESTLGLPEILGRQCHRSAG
jgi:acrylyl-CoA reductase (NADPH)